MSLVSIIMPYYKKKLFFLESVNSALNQTYKNTEIIIIYDDIDLSDFEYIYEITKLDSRIKIRWYNIIESTESTSNKLGPQAKFRAKSNWAVKSSDKNIGASVVEGRGIINISLVNILKRSAKIWNAPFRPIIVGPIRR